MLQLIDVPFFGFRDEIIPVSDFSRCPNVCTSVHLRIKSAKVGVF